MTKQRRRLIGVLIAVLVAVVPGLFIVVRNARKVTTGPVPFSLTKVSPDTALKYSVRQIGSKVWRLERRLAHHREAVGQLNADQAALGSAADAALAKTSALVAVADSCAEPGRKRALRDSAKVLYLEAKESVKVFTASLGRPELDADSLDEELKGILSK